MTWHLGWQRLFGAIAQIDVPIQLLSILQVDTFSVRNFDAGLRQGMGLIQEEAGMGNCRPLGARRISVRLWTKLRVVG